MYKKTGRNINVSRDDLINDVIYKLELYDNSSPHVRKNTSNPYRDAVYTRLAEGKTVQVPSDIHEEAIIQWTEAKKGVEQKHNNIKHNNIKYQNELDKLREYESNRYNENSSSRGDLPRDYEIQRKDYPSHPYIKNVNDVEVEANIQEQENEETHDFQEPEHIQQYTQDNSNTECKTCNTAHKYIEPRNSQMSSTERPRNSQMPYTEQSRNSQHPYTEQSRNGQMPYTEQLRNGQMSYAREGSNRQPPYVDSRILYDDVMDYNDTDDNKNNYSMVSNNMYKYLFYLVLISFVYVLYKNHRNTEELFKL